MSKRYQSNRYTGLPMRSTQLRSRHTQCSRSEKQTSLNEAIERFERTFKSGARFLIPQPNPKLTIECYLLALQRFDYEMRILCLKLSDPGIPWGEYDEHVQTIGGSEELLNTLMIINSAGMSISAWGRARVREELREICEEARVKIRSIIQEMPKDPWLAIAPGIELLEIEKDIIARLAVAEGWLANWFVRRSRLETMIGSVSTVSESFRPLYTQQEIARALDPAAKLLSNFLVDPRLDYIRHQWNDVQLYLNSDLVRRILGAIVSQDIETTDRGYKIVDPCESFEDVVLPESTKARLTALVEQFKSARSEGRESRLTVLLQGESGTGKSLTARAIAKELGAKCLIVQLGRVDRKSVPSVVSLFLARAKSMGCALVFEECEGLFNGNIFTGTDDGWAKLLFESYDGVAIFTTNYRLGYAMDRRMSMVIKFKAPDRKIRETIMLKEINAIKQAQGISKIPDEEAILGFARDTTTAGGFYRQILSLAVAQSPKGEITKAALTDAFEYAADVIQTSQDNGARESRISLKEVELPAAASRQVKHLIDYANKCISPLGVSPLLPQGATALFDGPPGSGKTITAEAIANELGIQMRRIGPSDLLSKWVGETEQQIRELFKDAEKKKYLLFIDEAEGLFASREGARSSWERTQANELLKQVESFKGVLIIATNLPELIDPAFGRRFLFQIHFPWPDAETRKRIWQKWTTELGVESSGLDELANKFEMSGGEIRNAAIRAIATGDTSVDGISAICRQISASRTGQVSKQIGI